MKLYEQIYQDLKDNILNRTWEQGKKIPSIMSISKQYQCSKGTVIKALELLSSQHIIFSKPQSGYYVADNFVRKQNLSESLYLNTANPLVDSFEILDIKHCLHLAVELYAKYTVDESLRMKSLNTLLPHQLAVDGIYTKPDNIHLIQGITQMLTLFTLHPFPNGKKTILIEEPSYYQYVGFLKLTDVRVLTIARGEQGIDLELLETYFKNEDIKFFYTIPRNHNPLGTSYSYQQKKKIMELALRYDVYIIEDDYFGGSHRLPKYVPMHFFSYQKNCIYLRSSTKEFSLIRIGMVVISDSFKKTFAQIVEKRTKYYSYYMPSLISQATWEAYIRTAIYEKHNAHTTQQINEKLDTVHIITASWNSQYVKVIGAKSGYYFTLQFHPLIKAERIIQTLIKRDVYITSNVYAYYHDEHYDNSARVSIARLSLEQLQYAFNIIYEEVEAIARSILKE
jgi:DNA-binding transcriptional MocR family regulator